MTGKPKFAMYWAASCGGCEIATINMNELILDFDATFEVAFWPVAVDAKYKDVEAMEDGEILVTLFNGGIRNDENEHIAKLLRKKSQILVAFGSCANEGCIPGLANLSDSHQVIDTAFTTVSTDNPNNYRPEYEYQMPEGKITIPEFLPVLRTLEQVVDVDYYIPGCPPETHQIEAVVKVLVAVVNGEAALPPKGTVLGAGNSTVCEECGRTRNQKKITEFRRIQDIERIDPELCLMEQGLICNGPATLSGCEAKCPAVNAPCAGCYGPALGVKDFGARMITAVASVIDAREPEEIERIMDGIVDPVGTFYRFGLANSLMQTGKASWNGK
jgi:F420-non-reducing hydrogenase small subunit